MHRRQIERELGHQPSLLKQKSLYPQGSCTMPDSQPQPISRHVFDTQNLVAPFPPKLRDRNKKVVYRIACPPGCSHGGKIAFSRWEAMSLPQRFSADDPKPVFERREDVFGYEPILPGRSSVEWY